MMPTRLRALLDSANLWYRGGLRRHIIKAWHRMRAAAPVLLLPSGWALLTWSMFLWNHRAWAASIGVFLLLEALTPVVAAYVAARHKRNRTEQ